MISYLGSFASLYRLINLEQEYFFFFIFSYVSKEGTADTKIIGIFSRLFKRDKKKQYLRLIPYTWKLLEMRMNSEAFSDLKKIFDVNIPKKIRNKIISK